MSEVGALLEQLIMAPATMRLGLAKRVAEHFQAAEARLATAEAENERLRAERQAFIQATMAEAARAAEARLATAVGLLKRTIWVTTSSKLRAEVTAFLASAQPAAPARTEAEQAGLYHDRIHRDHPGVRMVKTARAEAERAVLDALTELSTDVLDWWRVHGSVCQSNIAVAELARRGLK